MKTESKPASSARRENCSNSVGPNCSADALYPSLSMIPLRRHVASRQGTDPIAQTDRIARQLVVSQARGGDDECLFENTPRVARNLTCRATGRRNASRGLPRGPH